MPSRARDSQVHQDSSASKTAPRQGNEQHASAPSSSIIPPSPTNHAATTFRAPTLPSLDTSASPPTIVLSSPSHPSSPITLNLSPDGVDHAVSQDSFHIVGAPGRVRSRKSIDETSSPSQGASQLKTSQAPRHTEKRDSSKDMAGRSRRARLRSPWSCSILTLVVTAIAAAITFMMMQSFLTRQLDPKGCAMSMMRPAFAQFTDFDTEHTRFASKYSLFLYREGGIDEDTRVKGVPVLFIPGNAGSYKQVRPLAAQAAVHFYEHYQFDPYAAKHGKVPLDVFTVDFNEDITAFHGQTMLDQAEYLNEAVAYILSLYHNPHRSLKDPDLPDPSAVILVGHSMGGIVARTMLTMPNYQSNSVNTILTLAAPHSRAPVSFDSEIVHTYNHINSFWRNSYSQRWANNNPLWHVTLISIAGGSLDTLVPSEYAAVSSIVPPTHGFTVFTSTIPSVWTGMDHLAITWCDQLRKSVVPALYDIIDSRRSTQTRPRADRMRSFKRWLLTGMEDVAEKSLALKEPDTLLNIEDAPDAELHNEKLTRLQLGGHQTPKAYVLDPQANSESNSRFSLLTNQPLQVPGSPGALEVLFCNPSKVGSSSSSRFATTIDLSQKNTTTRSFMACKNAAEDEILLPSSNRESKFPFDAAMPFTYLQYDIQDHSDHPWVVIIDRANQSSGGWAVAEFSSGQDSLVRVESGVRNAVKNGIDVSLPAERRMMNEIKIPSVYSSLLAYKLNIKRESCRDNTELFMPFVRQYISEPYESKYFVNVENAEISLHGVAPYLPQTTQFREDRQGLSLQIWSDPTCNMAMDISIKVDLIGSLGKLWMRYRTVFAAFPLVIVALVLRRQFRVYDESGVFMSFSESIDQCLRTSIPVLYLALTMLAITLATSNESNLEESSSDFFHNNVTTEAPMQFSKYDLLLGSQDLYFWFLVPLFGVISIGVCVVLNYVVLALTYLFVMLYSQISRLLTRRTDAKNTGFPVSSLRKRLITTGVLLFLVSTAIPYQFVFMVLCTVQLATSARALNYAQETNSGQTRNFYNYAHSTLLLLLWILPINLPVFVVWIHNLAVHWLTPFSSHHNVLSIMPFILLIETQGTGRMIPRVKTWLLSQATGMLFFALSVGAAIYGVSYAYLLHSWVNILVGWLACIHLSGSERVEWLQLGKVFGITSERTAIPAEKGSSKQEESGVGEVKKMP